MTHCERVLDLLSDGQPHTYRELYDLRVMAHSRVADLRKRGHVIDCWRDGDDYLYQLKASPSASSPESGPADEPPPGGLDGTAGSLSLPFIDPDQLVLEVAA